ncbi:hypothetical protein CspHIS471_0502790 [Cutaneotrichosporon sp. HIS471]|nr:hypothetical protein CspHIS471_0502790 [Cutaneotrichosporon sp. HIS471]
MTLPRPRIATLEAFIIDTFTQVGTDGTEVQVDKADQIGGAGTYGIIGARIFLPPSRLAMIVDYTPETLPASMKAQLESYGTDMWAWRERHDGAGTTRAVNRYNGQVRGFEYLSAPLLLTPRALLDTDFQSPLPDWLHLVSYPARADQVIQDIAAMSAEIDGGWEPGLVWEPEPPSCVPENLALISKLTRQVDIISPNHTEALQMFGRALSSENELVPVLEWATRSLVVFRPRIGAVIRAGPLGCCYALTSELVRTPSPHPASRKVSNPGTPSHVQPVYWAPAFWHPDMPGYKTKVVDPTGAGNALMGGLMAALDEGKDMHEAVVWANVAASFVIEQDGLPTIKTILGREVWNGDYPWERVENLKRRMKM